MTGDSDLSVVVMAYNEAVNLERVVRELEGTLADLGVGYELLIVNDGSGDDTGAVADRLAASTDDIEAIHHDPNQGLGGVYRTGFAQAAGRFVTFFPADGAVDPAALNAFWSRAPDHDLVLGYLEQRRVSPLGRVLSKLERMLHRMMFGSTPRFQGVFMLRCAVLEELPLKSTGRGWGIVTELILRAQRGGYRIVSVPFNERRRLSGKSKVQNLGTIGSNVLQLLRIRWSLWTG